MGRIRWIPTRSPRKGGGFTSGVCSPNVCRQRNASQTNAHIYVKPTTHDCLHAAAKHVLVWFHPPFSAIRNSRNCSVTTSRAINYTPAAYHRSVRCGPAVPFRGLLARFFPVVVVSTQMQGSATRSIGCCRHDMILAALSTQTSAS
jgi:hypothetical protein